MANIYNSNSYTLVSGTSSADSIYNSSSYVTIDGGAGNDTLYNSGWSAKISMNGGTGNDTLYTISDGGKTLTGGTGSDVFRLHYDSDSYYGTDFITDYSAEDTIKIENVSITSVSNSGNDVIFKAGNNTLNVKNAVGKVVTYIDSSGTKRTYGQSSKFISLTSGNDYYSNTISGATVLALAGNDSIYNSGDSVSISGGDGADTVYNSNGNYSIIDLGAGNDSIRNWGGYQTISGGDGDDSIHTYSFLDLIDGGAGNDKITVEAIRDHTIIGGTGNDQISLASGATSNLIQYTSGDGNDLIIGFKTTDTLKIGNGTGTYSKSTVGSNVLVTVGSGVITLTGAASLSSVKILGTEVATVNSKRVSLTSGNDYYSNTVSGATVLALAGNDYIYNSYSSVSIDGGAGNDTIYNYYASNSTLNGGDGNDSIHNYHTNYLSMVGGDGNDTIYNEGGSLYGDTLTIDGGAGNDSIRNYGGAYLSINGGAGKDTIYSNDRKATILGGADDDYIRDEDGYYYGRDITVEGGTGNDTLICGSNAYPLFKYTSGDGNDSIIGFNATSTLKIGNGTTDTYSKSTVGSNVLVTVGYGVITLSGASTLSSVKILGTEVPPLNQKLISLTSGNDTYSNTVSGATVLALAGNDSIYNSYASVSIDGGAGNDTIYNNYYGSNSTLNGGAGNDTLYNSGWSAKISMNGGTGNDTLFTKSDGGKTLTGGTGSDLFRLYYDSDSAYGTDVITDYAAEDTIKIENVSITSVSNSGNDVIFKAGNNTLNVKNAVGKVVTYIDSSNTKHIYPDSPSKLISLTSGNDYYSNTVSGATILALAGNDSIYNSYASVSIDGGAGNDTIYNYYGSNSTLNGGDGNDSIHNYHTNYLSMVGGDGNDTIYNEGGSLYGDTLTIDGGAGNDSIRNYGGAYLSINGGAGKDTIYSNDRKATILGGADDDYIRDEDGYYYGRDITVEGGTGNDTLICGSNAYPLFKYTSGDGNDSIIGFNANSTLKIGNGTTDTYSKSTVGSNVLVTVGYGVITLNGSATLSSVKILGTEVATVNSKLISLTSGNDYYSNSVTGATIQAFGGNDYIYNSGDSVSISGGDGADTVYNYNGDYSTIDLGAGNDSYYANDNDNVTVNAGADSDTIIGSYYNSKINGGTGNDRISITGSSYSNSVDGDDGNDTIIAYGGSLNGGAGNDHISLTGFSTSTIRGGTGDDTIYANTSSTVGNMYQYTSGDGNDFISGFNATSTLKIGNGNTDTYSKSTVGSNVLVTVGSGVITLSGASTLSSVKILGTEVPPLNQKLISLTSGNDYYSNTVSGATVLALAGNDSIYNSYASVSIDGGAGNDTIYNNYYGLNSTLNGGDGNDSIYNNGWSAKISMNGGAGSDTLYTTSDGGKTLTGGTGSDLFRLYYDSDSAYGTDVITDYAAEDTIKIENVSITSVSNSGNDVIFKAGNNTLNVKNAVGKVVTYIDSSNTKHIYPDSPSKLISLTSGNDYYSNSVLGATIQALGGNDSIYNSYSSVSIDGGAGNDTIYNYYGSNSTLKGGDGNNYVYNYGVSVKVDLGYGNDYIYNSGDSVSISGGDGADTVYNYNGDYSTIDLGAGNDSYYANDNDNVTVNAGADSDTITGSYYGSKINGGAGNDLINITSSSYFNSVDGGDGNDTIIAYGGSLNGGAGNDHISITGNSYSNGVDGGDGNDTIIAYSGSLNGGAGNDRISLTGFSTSTIRGGTGDDTIYANTSSTVGNVYQYTSGDGNDLIFSYKSKDTLKIGNGTTDTYAKAISGNNLILTVGDGKITLSGAATLSSVKILGTEIVSTLQTITNSTTSPLTLGADIVTADASTRTKAIRITGNAKANTILGGTKNDTLLGGDGNDYLAGNAGNDSLLGGNGADTLVGGAGADKLIGGADNDSLSGGDGNDSLSGGAGADKLLGGAGNDTLNGGTGNDTLTSGAGNDLFIYALGDGNDVITDMSATDTLKIGNGTTDTYKKETNGNNLILTVGDGKITLTGAATLSSVKILGKEVVDNPTLQSITNATTSPLTLGAAVVTADASTRTKAIRITGNAKANTILGGTKNDTLLGGDGNDYLAGNAGNDSLLGGNGADTLVGGAGTDKLYGQAGNDSLNGGAGNDLLNGGDGADTLNGGAGNDTFTGGAGKDLFVYTSGNDIITDYTEEDTISITSGTANNVTESGNNVILTVGSNKITVKDGKGKKLTYYDADGKHTYPTSPALNGGVVITGKTARLQDEYTADSYDITDNLVVETIDASVITYDIELIGNKKANSILGGAGNDTLVGGKGNDLLTGGAGSDVFFYNSGDGNDIITDYTEEDWIKIASGTISTLTSGDDVILKIGNGRISVKGGKSKTVTYYDANDKEYQISNENVKFNDQRTAATILSSYAKSTFDETDYSSYVGTLNTINASELTHPISITGNNNANRIIGSKEDDYIDGGAAGDTILGGDGSDTLVGGKGNDNLSGGKGADVFVYSVGDGNDVITDYNDAEGDMISITSAEKVTPLPNGENVILSIGNSKITVKGGANKVINYVTSAPYFYPVDFNSAGTAATLQSAYAKDSFDVANYGDYAVKIKTIDASKVVRDLSIKGNANANKIIGSNQDDYIDGGAGADTIFGGDGNDTLVGGKGNDALQGDKGADVFLYNSGDGDDYIIDYENDDVIKINGTVSNVNENTNILLRWGWLPFSIWHNVILTVGNNKISVLNTDTKIISYTDNNGSHIYSDVVEFTSDGKGATLKWNYSKDTFEATKCGDYAGTLKTINASDVKRNNISITGNANANVIIGSNCNDSLVGLEGDDTLNGGGGNDTLWGGIGEDTLTGGKGTDLFLYRAGEGNDYITDYAVGEKISITGGTATESTSGNDLILTVGAGKITVKDGKNKKVTYHDNLGPHTHTASAKDLLIDDNYSTDAASLSEIVNADSASYTPYDFSASLDLTKEENFAPALTYSDKK